MERKIFVQKERVKHRRDTEESKKREDLWSSECLLESERELNLPWSGQMFSFYICKQEEQSYTHTD
jgi:hypothetical protein